FNICTHTHTHAHTQTHTCTHSNSYTLIHSLTHIHTCGHTLSHTHTHTHTQTHTLSLVTHCSSKRVRAKASCVSIVTLGIDRASSGFPQGHRPGAFGQVTLGPNRANWCLRRSQGERQD